MLENCHFPYMHSLTMEDIDIFHLFYHILDTNHLMCQVSLQSNKAELSKYTVKNWCF